jgi:hypothetical protein
MLIERVTAIATATGTLKMFSWTELVTTKGCCALQDT